MSIASSRRIIRRMTFRSRSASVVLVLVLAAASALWLTTEIVLEQTAHPALVAAPSLMLEAIGSGDVRTWIPATVAAALGLGCVIVAVAPGRRRRRALRDERLTVVVDDSVLAGALRRVAADRVRLPARRVRSTIGRRRADLLLTATSGAPVDAREATAAATELLATVHPRPAVRPRIAVADRGVVGA